MRSFNSPNHCTIGVVSSLQVESEIVDNVTFSAKCKCSSCCLAGVEGSERAGKKYPSMGHARVAQEIGYHRTGDARAVLILPTTFGELIFGSQLFAGFCSNKVIPS